VIRWVISLLCVFLLTGAVSKRNGVTLSVEAAGSDTPEYLWLKLNEGTGSSFTDDSTGGTGDGTGNNSWVTGKSGSGYAIELNGASQNADTTGSVTLAVDNLTVCLWVYPDAVGADAILVETGGNWFNAEGLFGIYISATGKLNAAMKGAASTYRIESTNNSALTTGAWQHVAVVFDRSTSAGNITIYVDGSDVTANIDNNNIASSGTLATAQVNLGSRGGISSRFDGRMDDVRIYDGDVSSSLSEIIADAQ
jgi:hypothetical protein